MKPNLGKDHKIRQALEDAQTLIGSGWTLPKAAEEVGVKYKTLWRWMQDLTRHGGDVEAVAKGKPIGRPPLKLTDEEVVKVQARVKGGMSEVMALRMSCHEGEIRGEIAARLLASKSKHWIPEVIRRQIKVAEAVKVYHNSPRDFRLRHLSTPRRNVSVRAGMEIPDEAGDVFVSDDMTVNFGWWTPWPFGDSDCSKRFGVKVTRGQLLVTMDLVSLKFLHFSLLVRTGESYRANDIWAEYGRIFRSVGMPRKSIIHEGGNWEGKHIHGEKIQGADEELRIGGLNHLGVDAIRSYSPKTKPIEGRFNYLQTAMESLPGNLGREKEGRKEWAIYNRCAAGVLDPREYLPSQTQIADKIQSLMTFLDSEPVEGRVKGIPQEIWDASVTSRPLKTPPRDMGWVFARDARLLTIPTKGPLKCRFKQSTGEEELYFDDTSFVFVPRGLKVMAHFDPLETGGEAVLISADTRTFDLPAFEGNGPRTVRPGEILCVARRVNASARDTDAPDENLAAARAKAAAVRTESRRIDSNKSRATKMAEAYDGFGNAIRVESSGDGGTAAAMPMTPPPRIRREIQPATSSRAMPANAAEEIRRKLAALTDD